MCEAGWPQALPPDPASAIAPGRLALPLLGVTGLFCRNWLDHWAHLTLPFGVFGLLLGDFVASHCSIFWLLGTPLEL